MGKITSKYFDIKEKCQLERRAALTEIERLFVAEKLSLKEISVKVKMSLITVRRVCRTLGLGRYAAKGRQEKLISKLLQAPFG
jgi:hypothetical protein